MEEQSFRNKFIALMADFNGCTDKIDIVFDDANECSDRDDTAMHLMLDVKHASKEEVALYKRYCQ
jgi:hypothetical protein